MSLAEIPTVGRAGDGALGFLQLLFRPSVNSTMNFQRRTGVCLLCLYLLIGPSASIAAEDALSTEARDYLDTAHRLVKSQEGDTAAGRESSDLHRYLPCYPIRAGEARGPPQFSSADAGPCAAGTGATAEARRSIRHADGRNQKAIVLISVAVSCTKRTRRSHGGRRREATGTRSRPVLI